MSDTELQGSVNVEIIRQENSTTVDSDQLTNSSNSRAPVTQENDDEMSMRIDFAVGQLSGREKLS